MAGLPLRIIAGLGNPGPEHLVTRHNAGFWFVDLLARRHGAEFRDYRKYSGETARIHIGDQDVVLLKPTTYMNRSGLSVRQLSDFFKVPPEEILVAHIGDNFWRLRLGVGHPGNKAQVIDYVLTRAPRAEEDLILEAVSTAADSVPILIEQGAERAMTKLHSRAVKA
jgi:PTH1 family peptidyl-tRNA hydrolase